MTEIPDRECRYNLRATTQVLVTYFRGKIDMKKGLIINVNSGLEFIFKYELHLNDFYSVLEMPKAVLTTRL